MTIAHSVINRVVILHGNTFRECIALEVGFGIKAEIDGDSALISFEGKGFRMKFDTTPDTIGSIGFVLVDPTQEADKQIVGIAERDGFDPSTPGRAYLRK